MPQTRIPRTDALTRMAATAAQCFARHREVLAGGGGVLAAVSGGIDSTALALVLAELARTRELPGPLVIAHVDHRVHERSAAGTEHVRELAARLGLPFHGADLPPARGHRSEQVLRDLRYAALTGIALAEGCRAVVTAHHADDDLETVLFRILRGTGMRGLTGVPELRPLAPGLVVVRPFLGVRRTDLAEVVREAGVAVCEDPTNADLRYARNRLRAVLIPELRAQLGVRLDTTLFALQRHARAALATLDELARAWLRGHARQPVPWRLELQTAGIGRDGVAPWLERVLALAWARVDAQDREPKPAILARLLAACGQHAGARVHGRGDVLLAERTRSGLLLLDPARAGTPPPEPVPLVADGSPRRFGTTEWLVRADRRPGGIDPTARNAGCRLAAVGEPWRLRTRRAGETFHPLGAATAVELARFLQSRHVPRFDRDRLPWLVDRDDQLLALPGIAVAERARVAATAAEHFAVDLRAG